jgi:hypothetical protein
MTVPTVPSEAVEAALNSLLAEPCFPDFLYEPARASAAQIAEVRQANLEAVERAFAAAVPVLQAQERERLKRVIEAKRDAFGPTQALAWSQGMSAAAFICTLHPRCEEPVLIDHWSDPDNRKPFATSEGEQAGCCGDCGCSHPDGCCCRIDRGSPEGEQE